MKYLLILTIPLFFISCKKDDVPQPVKEEIPVDYHITHSGFIDSVSYVLNENSITSSKYKSMVIDEDVYRYVNMTFWVSGDAIDVDTAYDTTYAFVIEVVVQYSFSELTSQGQMPPLTAAKLAQAINNTSTYWNDTEDLKDVYFVQHEGYYWTGLIGGIDFVIDNPQIQATPIGTNAISIVGSVDKLSVDIGPDPDFGTDIQFDYTIPVPY